MLSSIIHRGMSSEHEWGELIEAFRTWDTARLVDVLGDSLSTSLEGGVPLPPYVPFLGKNYWGLPKESRVLFYATAQNMGPWHGTLAGYRKAMTQEPVAVVRRLEYKDSSWKNYPGLELATTYKDISIAPYACDFLPFMGALVLLRLGHISQDLHTAHEHLAVSNFYKFSMHNGRRDLNPLNHPKNRSDRLRYLDLTMELVRMELEVLDPGVVIVFGTPLKSMLDQMLLRKQVKVIRIQDRSWILRGGSGRLGSNGIWRLKITRRFSSEERELFESYVADEDAKLRGRPEILRVYFEYHAEFTLCDLDGTNSTVTG